MKLSQLWIHSALAGTILACIVLSRAYFQIPEGDAAPYHARIKQAETTLEKDFGDWKATKVDVPTEAQKLLRSNILLSLQYVNTKKKQHANFLLVQCEDARNLSGHFPPVCYPNAGYTSINAEVSPKEIQANGMMYQFTQETLGRTRGIHVFNLMVLPDNQTSPDMSGIKRIARNRRLRSFGAAEIQVLTDADMPEEDRVEVINLLLAHYKPLIDEIRSGVVQ